MNYSKIYAKIELKNILKNQKNHIIVAGTRKAIKQV